VHRLGSCFPTGSNVVPAWVLRPYRLSRAVGRGRALRLGLAASCAAGCLLVATVATAGPPVAYTAYAGNFGGHTLTPINTATNATSATVAVNDPSAIAITPSGTTALVANWAEHTVTPITLATGTAGTPISVGNQPSAIAITPDGTKAYVSNYNANGPGTVTAITLSTGTTSTISVGRGTDAIAITPDGTMAYVADHFDGTVTPITIATNTAGTPITVGTGANVSQTDALAVSPNGATVYAANYGSNSVVPITVATNTAGTAITGITSLLSIAITPDGATAYIAEDGNPGNVVPLTLSNNSLGTAIPVGRNPDDVAISPDQATAYVANYNNNGAGTVTPINLATNTAGSNITVGTGPDAVAITPDQAPIASFTATPAPSGSASSFDASASTVAYGSITNYHWDFGDGNTTNTTTPTTAHTYATAGSFTTTLTETDTAGTSTTQTFTGQTMSRDGGPGAQITRMLTINSAPQVTTQPTAATVTAPNQATFAIGCSGSPAATVQWQLSTDTGVTWNNIPGQTTPTLTIPTTSSSLNANQYRAVCTNVAGSATSNAATLTVNTAPQVTTQPAATTVAAPNQASFAIACSGSPAPTLQWQLSTDTGLTWNNIPGKTAATLTIPTTSSSLNADQYRAVCTNVAASATTNAATLTVTAPSTGTTSAPLAPPVLGVKFEAQPHGVVFARTSPGGPLVQLSGPVDLHVGSLIDARSGTVTLVMAMPAGRTQSASVGQGSFTITQPRSQHGLTQIALAGSSFASCPAPGTAHASAAKPAHKPAKPSHVVRQLWSKDNHGQFQTHGHNSVATVRGTEWITQDRCDGTLTHVLRGVVSVRPHGARHSIDVTAGHSYLARP
jgi:DNA-binding beta-propeller fold protein YncE